MRTHLTIAWLLAAAPAAVLPQDVPGLDLSQPPRKPAPPDAKPDGDELPPIDLSKPPPPAQPPRAAPAPEEKEAKPVLPFSEKDVALGDKVKAVQRKGFMKRGRFELSPTLALSVNDAFYQKFGVGGRIAYHIEDSFALALRGTWYKIGDWYAPYRTDNVREGKLAFKSQLLSSQPYQQAMLDAIWSPVYGKASFLGRSIVHFDLFLTGGFGLVWSATSGAPRNEGPHFATDVGGGLRFYPTEWSAFELGTTATFYPDQPMQSVPGTVQKVFVANLGFSVFFPWSFDYVYP